MDANDPAAHPDPHVAALVGGLLDRIAHDLLTGAGRGEVPLGGLRPSHHRVIDAVPPDGATVTELAHRLRMTKQGAGQFVTHLVGTGHLETRSSVDDARVRVVRRTAFGEADVAAVTARMAALEHAWRLEVGEERYAVFRDVLAQLGR